MGKFEEKICYFFIILTITLREYTKIVRICEKVDKVVIADIFLSPFKFSTRMWEENMKRKRLLKFFFSIFHTLIFPLGYFYNFGIFQLKELRNHKRCNEICVCCWGLKTKTWFYWNLKRGTKVCVTNLKEILFWTFQTCLYAMFSTGHSCSPQNHFRYLGADRGTLVARLWESELSRLFVHLHVIYGEFLWFVSMSYMRL